MEFLDILLGIYLLVCLYIGFQRGFIGTFLNWGGIIASLWVIGKLGKPIISKIGQWLGTSPFTSSLLTYLLLLIAVFFLVKILTAILNKFLDMINLGTINRLFGAVFGMATGFLILVGLYLAFSHTPAISGLDKMSETSVLLNHVRNFSMSFRAKAIHELVMFMSTQVYFLG